jgi:hypothetical protein
LDADQPRPTDYQPGALTTELRDRIESLERQLEQANERDRENRWIIAALTSRIPAIEAPAETPQEPSESSTAATEQPGRVAAPQGQVEEAQDGAERRSWWQRMFGG